MKGQHKEVLFGLYNDEEVLMSAIRKAKKQHLDIMDVYSPFPIHGMDTVLELEESRLHIVGFHLWNDRNADCTDRHFMDFWW
jgi:pentose-5-phosphate-3-epimerase